MDMKRILQAMDGVATKPVVGVDSMSKFLRVVTEAEMNQPVAPTAPVAPVAPTTPVAPAAPAQPQATAAPAQPQVDPTKYQVPSVDFLKKNYKHPADIINGASPSSSEPSRIGAWEQGSDFDELMMALNGSYYQARQADPNYKQPAFVKDDWELIQRLLGTPEGKEYAIANWIGLSDINDTSPEAEFNRAQHKEFEKQANAKILAQKSNVIKPGWKYDQELGMTPAQAELQAQKAKQQQPATVQENIDKFLSIVRKNDVSILNEGTNPHKVALPVQMTMQHYQQATSSTTSNEPSLLKKYFHEVESEVNEQAQAKRQRVNQYASVIAERVLMKGSKNKILTEGELEVLRPADKSDDYDSVRFKIDGEPVEPGSEEFDYYYKLVFKKDPPDKFVDTLKGMMSKDHGSMGADPHKDSENDVQDSDVIIPSHPKGEWVKVRDIGEMAAHLRNDPDGHTIIPHGGMGSGKEETWKSVSTKKLQQVIDMINSGNYSGAEHVLYKNGFLQGAVQALARYEEFKAKQGKRRMKAGREVEIGEQGTTTDPQLKSKFEELLSKF